jgi:AraC family transcriptional activator of pobA
MEKGGDGIKWENVFGAEPHQVDADGLHNWDFNPELPVDIRFLRYDRHRQVSMTYHHYFELFYVYSGSAVFQIHDCSFTIKEGDLVPIGGVTYHRLREPLSPQLKAWALYFLPHLVQHGDSTTEEAEYLAPFLLQDPEIPKFITRGTDIPCRVFDLMKGICGSFPADSPLARLAVKTHLRMILVLIAKHYSAFATSTRAYELRQTGFARLRPLFDFVKLHPGTSISVEEAARILRMSRSYFMHLFKLSTGQSFIGYLNRLRIARAQVLLASTQRPLSEIAQEVGFCDQSYFGALFRRFVGVTPLRWRMNVPGTASTMPTRSFWHHEVW